VIQQYQAEQQLINEEDKSKGRSNESNNRSSVKSRSRKVDNTVTQKVKSATSKRMNKSSSKKHTRRYLTSSTYSSDRQQSGSSSSDSSRGRSKSPQHPKMSTFDGTGKPSWESFIYQFERSANRRYWRNRKKQVDYLTV
jgi:hypothetical protein